MSRKNKPTSPSSSLDLANHSSALDSEYEQVMLSYFN